MDDEPAYQRRGDLWSLGQRQRFIDSLLNGYDVPKFYLHDLRGVEPTKVYAVVDGKQRLHAIWAFLEEAFSLAPDFRLEGDPPAALVGARQPRAGMRFADMDPAWQAVLLETPLSVVLIQDAEMADIDELFARLNDGVPFHPAQRSAVPPGPRPTGLAERAS